MTTPSAQEPSGSPIPPPADPVIIRRCLPRDLADEFDHAWELVMERAKLDKSLAPVHELLNTWRHIAFAELREPGIHERLLAKAEQIRRTGKNPEAVPADELEDLIRQRLGRTV